MLIDIPWYALYIHLISAVLCMGISATFHLFYCHSKKCNSVLCRFDYAGISLLIGGSNFSPNYYGLYCKEYQTLLYIFLGIIEGSCLFAFFISLHPKFYSPSLRKAWAFMYVFIGVGGAFPGVYYFFFWDKNYIPDMNILHWLLGGIFYVGGALIYAFWIPEWFWPGWFDFCGLSHNIWHIMIIIAALFHFFGSLNTYHARRLSPCPSTPENAIGFYSP